MTQVTTSNTDIARRCYDLFAKGEIETLVNDYFDPNVTWVEPETLPEGGTHTGPQAIVKNVFETFQETWGADANVTPKRFFSDGDVVFALGDHKGTGTNGAYTIPFCHMMEFDNGRLVRFQNYTDTAMSLQALG